VRAAAAAPPASIIPPDSLFYLHYNPAGFSSQSDRANLSALPFLIRAATESSLLSADSRTLADSALAYLAASPYPQTLCLLSCTYSPAVDPEQGAALPARLGNPHLVLAVDIPADRQPEFLAALDPIFNRIESGCPTPRAALDYPGSAAAFSLTPPAPAQSIEWALLPNQVLLAFGQGTLSQWSKSLTAARADQSLVSLLRSPLPPLAESSAPPFLEAFANLDRLRALLPELAADGRLRPILVDWRLDNARNWMLLGRWSGVKTPAGGQYAQFDVCWQRRSEDSAKIAHAQLTQNSWPDILDFPVPAGSCVAVFPISPSAFVDGSLNAYSTSLSDSALPAFLRRTQDWRRTTRAFLPATLDSFESFLVLSNDPPPTLPIPGACSAYLQLKPSANPNRVTGQIQRALELLNPRSRRTQPEPAPRTPKPNEQNPDSPAEPQEGQPASQPRATPRLYPGQVMRDSTSRLSWVVWPDLPAPLGTLACPVWTFAVNRDRAAVLVCSWSPDAAIQIRDRIQSAR